MTPLMAQEFFVVHDFLSTPQQHEFPDWSVFHETLEMAVAQHASIEITETVARQIPEDLAKHCLDSLRYARALEVRVATSGERMLQARKCSAKETAAAVAAVRFS